MPDLTVYAAEEPRAHATLLLAHGAGAGARSRFMIDVSSGLAARGVTVLTFDFPYMAAGRKVPDAAPKLEAAFAEAVAAAADDVAVRGDRLFLGGKSMGGRIASMLAAHAPDRLGPNAAGLVFLGYPLHPPGQPARKRDEHFPDIRIPMLFVQGSRDAFGTPDEIRPYLAALPAGTTLHVVEGGDHSFKVPGGAAATKAAIERALDAVVDWIRV